MPRTFACRFGVMIAVLAWVPVGSAHDIPNARIDRSTQIYLKPGQLEVAYEVALAELTLIQDLRQIDDQTTVGDRLALFQRYARVVGPLNARGFLIQVDGREIELAPIDFTIAVEDHLRIVFQFGAEIPPAGQLSLRDTNYASSEGSVRLGLRVAPALTVQGDLPPPDVAAIPWQPAWQMSDRDESRAKQVTLRYGQTGGSSQARPLPVVEPIRPAAPPLGSPSVLSRLLDRPEGASAIGWLLTAFLLGTMHALQPGHGKTLVAAATLDRPHATTRGVGLGLVTTGSHLISVVAIAGTLWWFQPRHITAIHLIIARAAGFVIAAIGIFRVGRYLGGIESNHDGADHGSWASGSVWVLGLAGGFVPCWDAVALVVLANSVGQLRWGLTLLASFSLGMGAILVAVGWLAGQSRNGFVWSGLQGQWQRWIGLASGLILAAIGLSLLRV